MRVPWFYAQLLTLGHHCACSVPKNLRAKVRAAEVIEVCFHIIYKECPLRRTFDPLRCTSAAS